MTIKYHGFLTFTLSFGSIDVITDPLSLIKAGKSKATIPGDVVLHTDPEFYSTEDALAGEPKLSITPSNRESIFQISTPGEFEIGEVMIRRSQNRKFYLVDYGYTRIMYMGFTDNKIDIASLKDLGDVDVLILAVGEGELFPEYEKLGKLISHVDPGFLIPAGYKAEGSDKYEGLKSLDDFLKHFGYTNVREERTFKVVGAPESEEKNMEVIKMAIV